jgi:hypothetical protein
LLPAWCLGYIDGPLGGQVVLDAPDDVLGFPLGGDVGEQVNGRPGESAAGGHRIATSSRRSMIWVKVATSANPAARSDCSQSHSAVPAP